MIKDAIDCHLSVRRAVGFKLLADQTYLASYSRFAAKEGDTHMKATTAIAWTKLAPTDTSRAVRMNVLIRFARFARADDNRHEVPPRDMFCRRRQRRAPYIFSDDEVLRIVQHARLLNGLIIPLWPTHFNRFCIRPASKDRPGGIVHGFTIFDIASPLKHC